MVAARRVGKDPRRHLARGPQRLVVQDTRGGLALSEATPATESYANPLSAGGSLTGTRLHRAGGPGHFCRPAELADVNAVRTLEILEGNFVVTVGLKRHGDAEVRRDITDRVC